MTALLAILALSSAPGPDMCALARPLNPGPDVALLEQVPSGERDHDYDALYYTVEIEVLPAAQELDCTAGILFTPTVADLAQLHLDLRQLDVDAVWDDGGALVWNHDGEQLVVTLSSPLDPGDTAEVFVSYSGTPWNEGAGGWGGFWFSTYVFYHMGVGIYSEQPSLGRVIFPCWDDPSDKAGVDLIVTVPDSLYAVANGDLLRMEAGVDGTLTFHWSQPLPMSTYLAALSVSDYVDMQDSTYPWIHYYVYPWEIEDAQGSFANVNLIMDRFEDLYGDYPWNAKFSYVETPKGDMEHVTEVYHIAAAVNGSTVYDWLLAHEMSHQWWGDCVTEFEWSDVWLSEGFATYSEALWQEHYGWASYDQYMVEDIMLPYLASGELFPLTSPVTPAELWSYTTYQKGASVLHMLRHVMGDGAYFSGLTQYFEDFAWSNCSTADFQDRMEDAHGADLDWFFDTWVYDWGYPVYDLNYSWTEADGDWEVTVDLTQVQTTGPVFTMPLEFELRGSPGDTIVVMWNDLAQQSETFTVPFEPVGVIFDPGNFVLSPHLTGIGGSPTPPAGGTGTLYLAPNPASSYTALHWAGMSDSELIVRLYDLSGRMLSENRMGAGSRTLELTGIPAGLYLVEASGPGGIRQTTRLVVGSGDF